MILGAVREQNSCCLTLKVVKQTRVRPSLALNYVLSYPFRILAFPIRSGNPQQFGSIRSVVYPCVEYCTELQCVEHPFALGKAQRVGYSL